MVVIGLDFSFKEQLWYILRFWTFLILKITQTIYAWYQVILSNLSPLMRSTSAKMYMESDVQLPYAYRHSWYFSAGIL